MFLDKHFYPRLAKDVQALHRTPREGVLVFPLKSQKVLGLGHYGLQFVNHTASRILSLCTGRNSTDEIVRAIYPAESIEIGRKQVRSFLIKAKKSKFIKFHRNGAEAATARFTGSFDYYIPYHISVELTARCNLRCLYCYNEFQGVTDSLSFEQLKSILLEWNRLGLMSLELTGGEPILSPHFWDVLDFCCGTFQRIGLLTNGTLIDTAAAQRMAQYKDKLVISVSLDGSSAEYHDTHRGPGSFDKVVCGIRALVREGVRLRVGMCVTPRNIQDLDSTANFVRSLGVKIFSYAPAIAYGRGKQEAWTWEPSRAKEIQELESSVIEQNRDIIPILPAEELKRAEKDFGSCGIGTKNVALTPSGKIKACLFLAEEEHVGDLSEESLEDVFRKPIFKAFAELRNPSPERCGGCRYVPFCKGCSVRALTIVEREHQLCRWAVSCGVQNLFRKFSKYENDGIGRIF
ncbi:MAG: radical SAM protein [Acidobacteriia bacterium]|nr:radical SAM protein [Terriglobia bacterium]